MSNDLANIDQFHKCVGVVLNLMYENFPNPIDIDALYIEGKGVQEKKRALVNFDDEQKAWEQPGNSSESNPIKSEITVYMNSIFFLRNEGYIQSKEPSNGQFQRTFFECTLTSKGLAVLGYRGVKEKINWGRLIHTAIKDGQYKLLQDIVVKILSEKLNF